MDRFMRVRHTHTHMHAVNVNKGGYVQESLQNRLMLWLYGAYEVYRIVVLSRRQRKLI